MAADDRRRHRPRPPPHAVEDGRRGRFALGPDRVDDRERPAAHRRDIGEVDHHAAPSGEPGIGGDKGVDKALDGEQQMAVAVGNRGAIVADRNCGAAQSEAFGDDADIGLGGEAGAVAQPRAPALERGGVHLRPPSASATKPISGARQGG